MVNTRNKYVYKKKIYVICIYIYIYVGSVGNNVKRTELIQYIRYNNDKLQIT